MPLKQFWFIHECPCPEECSSQSWKKAQVWGWSEEACKKALKRHLTLSSNHAYTWEEADMMSEAAELETDFHDSTSIDRAQPRTPIGKPPKRAKVEHTAVEQQTEHDIEAMELELLKQPETGNVVLRAQEFEMIIDSINRVANVTRQAMIISQSAAKAFAAELKNTEATKANLEQMKFTAELRSGASASNAFSG